MEDNRDKKIEDYLHLYLGCRCEVETYMANLDWGMKRVEKLTAQILAGVHGKRNRVLKLILRPLSDMSEEDFKELAKLPLVKHGDIDSNKVLFLLSKHFDLFGLIEAGLAIDKTTLKI